MARKHKPDKQHSQGNEVGVSPRAPGAPDGPRTPGEDRPPEAKSKPPAPEQSNRDHPAAVGSHKGVAGEGIVQPITAEGVGPGGGGTAPGAQRPGTTRSKPAAVPSQSGPDIHELPDERETEAVTEGGMASLDTGDTPTPVAEPGEGIASVGNYQRVVPHEHSWHARHGAGHVQDLMTSNLEVCQPNTELYYVARMMAERDCGAIPVVQNTNTMRPIGIVTDRDIVVRVLAKHEDPYALRAEDCMSTGLVSVHPQMALDECLTLMRQKRVRRAPVVDDRGRCVGMIALADIAQFMPEHETAQFVKEVSAPQHPGTQEVYH